MRRVAIACRSIRVELVAECFAQMYFSKYAKANARRIQKKSRRAAGQDATENLDLFSYDILAQSVQRYGRAASLAHEHIEDDTF